MLKLSLFAAGLTAALGACGTDDSGPDVTDPPAPTTFKLRIENIAPWTVLKSGTHATRTDGTSGPIGPGQAYEISFTAGKNQKVSFASMLGQSNDWFFAPGVAGIALYDANGNPRAVRRHERGLSGDAGRRSSQEPGVRQRDRPEAGDPRLRRSRSDREGPPARKVVKLTSGATSR